MNVIFMPMFIVGLAGVSRRLFDGGATYDFAQPVLHLERRLVVGRVDRSRSSRFPSSSTSSGASGTGRRPATNPWQATTLEWAAPSPPPHGNFLDAAGGVPRAVRVQRSRRGQGLRAAVRGLIRDGHSLHRRGPPRHRPDQRQDRHLALPGLGGHAVRRPVRELHPDPDGGAELAAGRHDPERPARHVQHDRPDLVLRHDGHGLGVADAPPLRDVPDLHGGDDPARVRLPRGQVLRVQPPSSTTGSIPAPTTSSPSTSP